MRSLSTVAVLVASAAFAQSPSPRVGIVAGFNQSRIAGTATDISNHSGAAAGAYVVVPTSPDWSLQIGGVWTQKGWERDEPGTRDLAVAKLTYLEVPLLLRRDFATRERIGAVVFAGPSIGFRTGCSVANTEHSTGRTATAGCDEVAALSNGTFEFSSYDVGVVAGAGARFTVARARLVAGVQYEIGLKKIATSGDNKNRAATVSVGLEFPLKR